MQKSRWNLWTALLLAQTLWWLPPSHGQSARVINYDGRLAVSGAPANGSYSITFSLYEEAEGGSALWSEAHDVQVQDGLFSAMLGSKEELPLGLVRDREQIYLAVTIGGAAEMQPRLLLASTAYALRATVADGVQTGAIDAAALADGAVGEAKIASGAVTADKLASAAVTAAEIADGSVTAAKLSDASVTSAKLSDEAVTAVKLANASVTAAKLAPGSAVTSVNGRQGALVIEAGENVDIIEASGTFTISASGGKGGGGDITAVTAGEGLSGGGGGGDVVLSLADQGVRSTNLADGSVLTAKLADEAVVASKLAVGSVTASKIAAGAVTSDKLAGGAAVTSFNGTAGAVEIVAGANVAISGADGTYTIAAELGELPDGAVTSSKLADAAVLSSKLADTAVTTPKLADASVTSTKLASASVTTSAIEGLAVTTEKLADGSVTAAKLGASAVVRSLNGETDQVRLVGGTGIRISDGSTAGDIVIAVTGFRDDSSIRWKQNVQPLQNALSTVQRLRGVSYEWRESGAPDIGLIAEEVGAVIPEVVEFEEDGVQARAVNYGRLVAVLIEAVKEQQLQIDARDRQLEELSARVAALERGLASAEINPEAKSSVEETP